MGTVLKFKAPGRARERIVLFGIEGVGKTRAGMQIAAKTVGNVYIVETDNTYDEFLESPNFEMLHVAEEYVGQERSTAEWSNDPLGTIFLYRVRKWQDYVWAMNEVFNRASGDDWIFVDNITNMWGEVQTWYTIEAYGKDPAKFALDVRKAQIAKGPEGKKGTVQQEFFQDWGAINPQYMENIRKKLQSPPCHLLFMAEQKVVDMKEEKDKEIRAIFGPYGVKPAGQKSLGHDGRSILLLTKDSLYGQEKYGITTTKDRERVKLSEEPWSDFMSDYLRKVGGWKACPVVIPDEG